MTGLLNREGLVFVLLGSGGVNTSFGSSEAADIGSAGSSHMGASYVESSLVDLEAQ